MKRESLGTLSDDEVLVRREQMLKELTLATFQLRVGQLENTASLRRLRRGVAYANGELRRREISMGIPKGELLERVPASADTSSNAQTEESTGSAPRRSWLARGRDAIFGAKSK